MPSIKLALLYSVLSRFSLKLIGLVSTIAVARLLTPAEIGTFAIASSLVMIVSEFKQLGAGVYVIREETLTEEKIRNALGLTVTMCWSLGCLLLLASPWVATFYGIDALMTIFMVLAVTFFLAPYISLMTALHERAYHFNILFKAKNIPAVLGLIATIGLILAGYSFYSLAWGQFVTILVELAVILYYKPDNMQWIPSFNNMGKVAQFGVFNSFASLLRKSLLTVPDLIIGKLGTTTQVGIFSRGLGFVDFVHQTITSGVSPVVLPYLSSQKRQSEEMRQAYLTSTTLMLALIWPVMAVAAIASEPAILLLFGDQWLAAAPLASMLFIWGIFRSAHIFSPNILVVLHLERAMFFKDLLVFIVFCSSFYLLFGYGMQVATYSFIIAGILEFCLLTLLLSKGIDLGLTAYIKSQSSNISITLVCAAAALAVDQLVDFTDHTPALDIAVIAVVLPLAWLSSVYLLKHPLADELTAIARKIRSGNK